jgi:phosphatidylserine decarboxylase
LGLQLARYGHREIWAATILAVALSVAFMVAVLRDLTWWWASLAFYAVVAVLYAWVLYFFRDPDRAAPAGAVLLSPADGTVSDVTPVGADSPLGCEGTRVGIFMSIFDVHVNRSPCAGEVAGIMHTPGAFIDARSPDATYRNEATTITITQPAPNGERRIVVRQIAGLVARRIVTDLAVGDKLSPGQRIGMIKFGSRLEVLWPAEMGGQVRVTVGRKVLAGETIILAAE